MGDDLRDRGMAAGKLVKLALNTRAIKARGRNQRLCISKAAIRRSHTIHSPLYPTEAAIPSIFDWSSTAASNTTIDSINTNTGMSPANVDNVLRSIAAIVRSTFASALQNFLAGSAALPIANGGTAATTAADALASLGALADDYRDLPLTTKTAAWTFADAERGGRINYTGAAAAATINPNATTSITDGATYVIRNAGSGAITVTRGTGVTLKVNGGTSSANATIAIGGLATLIRWGTDDWTISGSGVS